MQYITLICWFNEPFTCSNVYYALKTRLHIARKGECVCVCVGSDIAYKDLSLLFTINVSFFDNF